LILKENFLFYGEHSKKKSPNGIINLFKGNIKRYSSDSLTKKGFFGITIVSLSSVTQTKNSSNKTFFFAFSTEEVANKWINSLNNASKKTEELKRNFSTRSKHISKYSKAMSQFNFNQTDSEEYLNETDKNSPRKKRNSLNLETHKNLKLEILQELFKDVSESSLKRYLKKRNDNLEETVHYILGFKMKNPPSPDLFVNQVKVLHQERKKIELEKRKLEQKKEKNEGLEKGSKCVICFERNISVCYVPCKHICVCDSCNKEMNKCPLCRSDIKSYFTVYLA